MGSLLVLISAAIYTKSTNSYRHPTNYTSYFVGFKRGLTFTWFLLTVLQYTICPTSPQTVLIVATLADQHVNTKFNRLPYKINSKKYKTLQNLKLPSLK